MDCSPPGTSVQGDSPGKNIGVSCHALLQGIFQPRDWTQVSLIAGRFFPGLGHQGSPRILEWVAYSFSRPIFRLSLLDPGIESGSPALQVDSPAELPGKLDFSLYKFSGLEGGGVISKLSGITVAGIEVVTDFSCSLCQVRTLTWEIRDLVSPPSSVLTQCDFTAWFPFWSLLQTMVIGSNDMSSLKPEQSLAKI